MEQYLFIAIAIAIAAVVIYVAFFRKHTRTIFDRVYAIKNRAVTEQGFTLWAESDEYDTQHQFTFPFQNAVARGLDRAIAKARCRNYTRALSRTEYIVAVVTPSEERSSDGMPAYAEPAGPYAGGIYDHGGYILVAGQMISADVDDGNIIAVPMHSNTPAELTHLALAVEYEAEHIILAYNDGDEFERTKFHTADTPHPIIPDCPGDDESRHMPIALR